MNRKSASGITLTVLLICILTLVYNIQSIRAEPTTWYVDDDGPSDFSSIQEAIDSPLVVDGDTIYVHNGTYYENVVVDKTLSLVGESKHNTIIDGNGVGNVIHILTHNVNLTGFTIQGSGYGWWEGGIKVDLGGCNIDRNLVLNNQAGIVLWHSDYNNVTDNITVLNAYNGIVLSHSTNNIISRNIALNNMYGISLSDFSIDNTIEGNIASDNTYGISFWYDSDSNRVVSNNASNNDNGIYICESKLNIVFHNNFIDNTVQAVGGGLMNVWHDFYPSCGNYWSDYVDQDFLIGPAQDQPGSDGIWDHPYIIDENHQDGYPLASPWAHSWIPPTPPPAGAFADLVRRRAWPEHHHYVVSKDENAYQTLHAKVKNLGNQTVWVKAIFKIAKEDSSTEVTETDPLLITQEEITVLPANFGPLTEQDVGKYSISAFCWYSPDKVVWVQGEATKKFSFSVVS